MLKRNTHATVFALILIVIASVITGCASPREQWAAARMTLTQTEHGLVAANQSGALSDKDFVATEASIKAARASLAGADEELKASNDQPTDKVHFYLSLTNGTLQQLQKYGVLTKKKK